MDHQIIEMRQKRREFIPAPVLPVHAYRDAGSDLLACVTGAQGGAELACARTGVARSVLLHLFQDGLSSFLQRALDWCVIWIFPCNL